MALLDIRQRGGSLFLAVVVGHILLISAQVNSRKGVPVLQEFTFGIFSEVQRAVSSGASSVRNAWAGYVALRQVKTENDELKRQLAAAQIAMQQQRALASRATALEHLLELRTHTDAKTAASRIIGSAPDPEFRSVTIDKGTTDGLRADMPVLAPAGIVGRVVLPSPRSATVQLLVDRNAAAGVLIERTRAQAIVVGGGADNRLRMEYVSEVFELLVGDVVVTSGIDGVYPKGFVVGRIESFDKSGGAYRHIIVRPAVDFSSLEDVLVILTPVAARHPAEGVSE